MITHRSFRFLLVFFLSIGMISCTKKKTANDQFPREQTLWVNWGTEPPTLDWNLANDLVSGNILFNLMEPLVGLNLQSKNLEPIPGLLTRWSHNSDFTKWTFKLASGVKWTDGAPFTMEPPSPWSTSQIFTIYSATNLSLISKRVNNYSSNPLERLIFKDMHL